MIINKQDTNGTKSTLGLAEFGYDNYTAGGDKGRVYIGDGTSNIALAKKSEVDLKLAATANAVSATKLATARTINSVSFDGTANITIADSTKLPLTGGTLTGSLTATSFSGSGASLTSLNASNLSSGTVPDARISGSYTGMTNLTGSGTVDFSKFYGNAADSVTAPSFSFTADTNTGIYQPAADQLAVTTGGVQRALFSSSGITGTLIGNASTATKLATARTISLTGDILGSASFDGSGNISIAASSNIDVSTTNAISKAQTILTGGGTLTVTNWSVLWSTRFMVAGSGNGSHFSTNGYFDITCPTSGTITGAGGASNVTATTNGIPLTSWQSIYYILPIGSSNTSIAANFRVVSYSSALVIPDTWVKICTYNGDSSYIEFANDVKLKNNKSINTSLYTTLGSDVEGNVPSASKLATARTISLTGDSTGSASFDGSGNVSIAVTRSTANVLSDILAVDGSGSGLDADLLDGQQGSYYLSASNLNAGTVPDARISGSYTGLTNLTGTGTVDFSKFYGNAADSVTAPSFSFTGDTNTGIYQPAADQLAITTGGVQRALFSSSGITGTLIGNASTATSAAQLTTARTINGVSFNGTANITVYDSTKLSLAGGTLTGALTATSFTETSDKRLKENVETIKNANEKVNQLRGVTYNLIENQEQNEIGFIAQEVEEIIPELVQTNDEGFKSVSYARTVALLVEAMKEQTLLIKEQNERINILENLIKGDN